MSRRRRLLHLYARVGRVYWAWAPSLVLLAVIVFIPVGFVDALLHGVDTSSINVTEGFKLAAFVAAFVAITASSLFGEVFFSGAVAISLTHPEHEHPPTLRAIAGRISYLKLIAVDVLYVLSIIVGAFVLIVGLLVPFIYFALAGPVVELEKHSVRGGFARSFRLVRGHFWMVAAVVIPIEIVGDLVNDAVVGLSHAILGHGLLAAWVGESVSNILTTPFFAVAVVLLTLELIHHQDGSGPVLKHHPAPISPIPEPA
jgi:hypothetical protein